MKIYPFVSILCIFVTKHQDLMWYSGVTELVWCKHSRQAHLSLKAPTSPHLWQDVRQLQRFFARFLWPAQSSLLNPYESECLDSILLPTLLQTHLRRTFSKLRLKSAFLSPSPLNIQSYIIKKGSFIASKLYFQKILQRAQDLCVVL